MWRFRPIQSPDSVVLTKTEHSMGRAGAEGLSLVAGFVEMNASFSKAIRTAGSVWHVLICLIVILSIAGGIWSGLGLLSPTSWFHYLLRIRTSGADAFSKSQRNCWLLFEMFVLAISDTNVLPSHYIKWTPPALVAAFLAGKWQCWTAGFPSTYLCTWYTKGGNDACGKNTSEFSLWYHFDWWGGACLLQAADCTVQRGMSLSVLTLPLPSLQLDLSVKLGLRACTLLWMLFTYPVHVVKTTGLSSFEDTAGRRVRLLQQLLVSRSSQLSSVIGNKTNLCCFEAGLRTLSQLPAQSMGRGRWFIPPSLGPYFKQELNGLN